MSEKLYAEGEWPFEPELIGFNGDTISEGKDNLEDRLMTFELSTDRFIGAFASAMNGTAGQHFFDAIALSHNVRIEHVTALEELSEYIYDSMDRDTAVRVWTTIVRDSLIQIHESMVTIDPRAGFAIPSLQDLQEKGLIYIEGLDKAFEEGEELYRVSEAIVENEEEASNEEPVSVLDLPALLEAQLDAEDPEDFEQMKDEYGQWVIAEYCNNLGEYLDNLLELCPPDKYPELH